MAPEPRRRQDDPQNGKDACEGTTVTTMTMRTGTMPILDALKIMLKMSYVDDRGAQNGRGPQLILANLKAITVLAKDVTRLKRYATSKMRKGQRWRAVRRRALRHHRR